LPKEDKRRFGQPSQSKEGPEVGVSRDKNTILIAGAPNDDFIISSLKVDIADMKDIVPFTSKCKGNRGGQCVVDKELQAILRRGS
jgi:hypothetical protein